jgi:hypothetical protein
MRNILALKSGTAAQLFSAAAFAGTGAGAVIGLANEISSALLGVPVPVLLAAAAGAFFAITFREAVTVGRGLVAWSSCTLAGAFASTLALYALNWPPNLAGAVAFFTAAGLPVLGPPILVEIQRRIPDIFERLARKVGPPPPGNGQGDQP